MAQSKIELEITWENNVAFTVTTKENAGPVKTLILMDENGEIANLWPSATDLLERYIKSVMAKIGKEMKLP